MTEQKPVQPVEAWAVVDKDGHFSPSDLFNTVHAAQAELDAIVLHKVDLDRGPHRVIQVGILIARAEAAEARAAELEKALDDLVMACELPGDHCELQPSLDRARAAIAKEKDQ